MKQHNGRQIERVNAFLSREHAQAKPDTTVTLSVISGSSVLAFTKLSGTGAVTALSGLVRLFF
ncbi:MAG: hypothetical protein ACJ74X_09520 [Gaiellaceae bacterium]